MRSVQIDDVSAGGRNRLRVVISTDEPRTREQMRELIKLTARDLIAARRRLRFRRPGGSRLLDAAIIFVQTPGGDALRARAIYNRDWRAPVWNVGADFREDERVENLAIEYGDDDGQYAARPRGAPRPPSESALAPRRDEPSRERR